MFLLVLISIVSSNSKATACSEIVGLRALLVWKVVVALFG